ncbi:hypothetical protein MPER_00909, partial [Moniliophthora perniciosa FA553]
MGLGCSYRTKRYISDLRPAGSPSRSKKGIKGLMSLLSENSAAGEELRMIAFYEQRIDEYRYAELGM